MAALRALHTECGSHDKGCSTSQPTLQYQKASRRGMAIYPEPHVLEPRVTMFNTSAVLPGTLGCDLSDYKKHSWSVTWGSDDRRRETGSTFIGQMYLYRVRPTVTLLLAPPVQIAVHAGAARCSQGSRFFRANNRVSEEATTVSGDDLNEDTVWEQRGLFVMANKVVLMCKFSQGWRCYPLSLRSKSERAEAVRFRAATNRIRRVCATSATMAAERADKESAMVIHISTYEQSQIGRAYPGPRFKSRAETRNVGWPSEPIPSAFGRLIALRCVASSSHGNSSATLLGQGQPNYLSLPDLAPPHTEDSQAKPSRLSL
jgi:hypothetical protein